MPPCVSTACFKTFSLNKRRKCAAPGKRPGLRPKQIVSRLQKARIRKPGAPCLARALRFQEQIQGPENASIARFSGLCCYQSRSEISDGLRSAGGRKSRFAAPPALARLPKAASYKICGCCSTPAVQRHFPLPISSATSLKSPSRAFFGPGLGVCHIPSTEKTQC